MFTRTLLTLSVLMLPGQAPAPAGSLDDKRISVTVPAAPWALTLPGDGLAVEMKKVKPDGRHGYFLLSDGKRKLSLSMYIEPAVSCKSSKECRDRVWKAGNPSWEDPQNVVLSEIGDVSFFEFFMPSFRGAPVRQQHMYAQFVVDGFWVDLHISKPLYQPHEHKLFEEVVKSVKFEPKKEDAARAQDTPVALAQRAAESWLKLWDAGEYKKCYEEFSQDTRARYTLRNWYVYWYGVRKPLGKVKSRKLTLTEYQASLPDKPDQKAVALMYESSFENEESVRESFSVFMEKDGEWRVRLYLADLQ